MTRVQCRIKNNTSSDLILDSKGIKAMGFAHIAEGKYHWDTEPPGKISAKGGEASFSASNDTMFSYISVNTKYKASVDDFPVNINLGASADSWPGGYITEIAEVSKQNIVNVRQQAVGGNGNRVVAWTITEYPD